jgi:replicative DNA helicase
MISGRGRSQKVEYLLKDSQNRVRENPAIAKIPTGFRVFDSVLGGGLGAGELGICLAPTSVGKSFWLNSVGAHALKLRRKIFQITLEISVRKVIARYESLLTRVPKARLHIQSETVSRALDRARRLVEEADIRVQEFPIRSLSVDELRALLTQTITVEEFMPDLIIIDYADIMKPIVRSREEKRYESLGAIYEGLRAIAQEFDVPLWSASQANKRSIGRPYVTLADMAESFAKAQTADVVIALCKTQAETQQHRGRFFVAKNRDNPSNIVIPFREDFDIGRFEEAENAHPEEVNPTETEYSEGEPGTHNEDENVPF